jgi:hypothetical protein
MTKYEKEVGIPKAKDVYVDDVDSGVRRHLGRRKDTKRWCKGKVGREHKAEIVRDPQLIWRAGTKCQHQAQWLPCTHLERCTECGKILRRWLPVEECPDRVQG